MNEVKRLGFWERNTTRVWLSYVSNIVSRLRVTADDGARAYVNKLTMYLINETVVLPVDFAAPRPQVVESASKSSQRDPCTNRKKRARAWACSRLERSVKILAT